MHEYTIDSSKRTKVIVVITVLSITVVFFLKFTNLWNQIMIFIGVDITETTYLFFTSMFELISPLSLFGIFYFVHDKYLWKYLQWWHNIPDLSGKWHGVIKSELKEHTVEINVTIKQSWNKIKIETHTQNSCAYSESASLIGMANGSVELSYAFQTYRNNQIPYNGFNKLIYTSNPPKLCGEYFTQKEIDALLLIKNNFPANVISIVEKGMGSKGCMIITKKSSY